MYKRVQATLICGADRRIHIFFVVAQNESHRFVHFSMFRIHDCDHISSFKKCTILVCFLLWATNEADLSALWRRQSSLQQVYTQISKKKSLISSVCPFKSDQLYIRCCYCVSWFGFLFFLNCHFSFMLLILCVTNCTNHSPQMNIITSKKRSWK